MNDTSSRNQVPADPLAYLLPCRDAFWRWSDDGNVIESREGGTIAFREQVRATIAELNDQTLPRFDLLTLVFAACRDTWLTESTRLRQTTGLSQSPSQWTQLLDALNHIHSLPRQIRFDPVAIATMIEIIVEPSHRTELNSDQVLKLLAEPNWLQDRLVSEPQPAPSMDWSRIIDNLTTQLTVDRILNRMATGLDRIPESAQTRTDLEEVDQSQQPATVRQLVNELRNDEELCGFVRMVRMLSAVLTLPKDLSASDELPQGGISDISSRGPLDRLLLSELANDDETLMSRVALGEALYLRRESPPFPPERRRTLLIDVGIRMWGIPRLCAAAIGLALASQNESHGPASVFRSSATGLVPVDFTTRAGLIEHLEALDHRADPAGVLDAWQSESAEDARHRILITCDDVLQDAGFRRQFLHSKAIPCFVATVNREGRVRLLKFSPQGEKTIREMRMDPEEILGHSGIRQASLVDHTADSGLPAILRLHQLPLRLPYSTGQNADALIQLPESEFHELALLQMTRDGRLLLWDDTKRGGLQLTDRLPAGKLLWSGRLQNDESYSLVVGGNTLAGMIHVRVDRGMDPEITVTRLNVQTAASESQHVLGVSGHLGVLLLILKHSVFAVDPLTGRQLDVTPLGPSQKWRRDRQFLNEGSWKLLSYSAGRFAFETLLAADKDADVISQTLGIVGNCSRPYAVLRTGELFDINDRKRHRLAESGIWLQAEVSAVSDDGQRCVLTTKAPFRGSASVRHILLSVDEKIDVKPVYGNPQVLVFGRSLPAMDRSLFRKPVRLSYGRKLAIVTRKGRHLAIEARMGHPAGLLLRDVTESASESELTDAFQGVPSPDGVRYLLKQVTWKDGSRAVLDSRGMLHLQSSDDSVPELSLILDETHVSGWCSTGKVWGLEYFLSKRKSDSEDMRPEQVMHTIRMFLEALP